MRQYFKKDNLIRYFEVEDGKVIATFDIGGVYISNPSVDVLYADGWQDYVQPTPPEPTKDEQYKMRVVELIREQYDQDDEMALLRQRDSKPQEFAAYNTYCEQCKTQAHHEIYG